MKNNLILIVGILVTFFMGCTKTPPGLEAPIPKKDINIIVQATDTINVYRFINAQIGKTATAKWDLGNSVTATGDTAYGKYPFAGTYVVTLTVFNGVTAVVDTIKLSLTKDNVALDSVYTCLTGGLDSTNGKTWVMDSTRRKADGTLAPVEIINTGSNTPKDYRGTGLYNSTWTFWLAGNKLVYDNKGYAMCHSSRLTEINTLWGAFSQTGTVGGDPYGTYTPKRLPQQSWTMSIKNGIHYLQFKGGAFVLFYRGCEEGIEYQISSINKNEMVLTHFETSPAARLSAGWSDKYYLVRKGFVR